MNTETMEPAPSSLFIQTTTREKQARDKTCLSIFSDNVTGNIDFPVRWDRMQDTFEGNYFRERKPRNENNS